MAEAPQQPQKLSYTMIFATWVVRFRVAVAVRWTE